MEYLLDTSVISELRKKQDMNANLLKWSKKINPNDTYLSVITIAELHASILTLQRQKEVQKAKELKQWLNDFILINYKERILPISPDIALMYSRLMVPDSKPAHDALIGATAWTHNLVLVSKNVGNYSEVPVNMINPFDLIT